MKTLRYIVGGGLLRALAASVLLTFGLETRLPSPPATPVPTYYLPDNGDFGLGATFDLVPDGSGGLEIDDWSIPTPDGTLTPADSTLISGGDFPAQSFFDIFTDLTIPPPVVIEYPYENLPSYWDQEISAIPGDGSIAGPSSLDSVGQWTIPDNSPTWLLLMVSGGVLGVGGRTRKFQTNA